MRADGNWLMERDNVQSVLENKSQQDEQNPDVYYPAYYMVICQNDETNVILM